MARRPEMALGTADTVNPARGRSIEARSSPGSCRASGTLWVSAAGELGAESAQGAGAARPNASAGRRIVRRQDLQAALWTPALGVELAAIRLVGEGDGGAAAGPVRAPREPVGGVGFVGRTHRVVLAGQLSCHRSTGARRARGELDAGARVRGSPLDDDP